jgi:iron complex transport system substrate-binding protein
VEQAGHYPQRIISLSPSATEILFAIGAGNHVIAVDDNSNFPKNAPFSKLSSFTPNVEAIAAKHPDFVILQSSATKAKEVQAQLKKLNISVFIEETPSQIVDAYQEFLELGKLSGHSKESVRFVAKMKREIREIVSHGRKSRPVSIYHELDNTLYSASSSTFIGQIYRDFNFSNIADAANTAASAGYPQLTAEYIVKSNPVVIFLADGQYGESQATLKARAGWNNIKAVKSGNVLILPPDIPNRWGPRLVDLYRFIASATVQTH